MLGFAIQFDGIEELVLLDESFGVFHEQGLDLADVVTVSQVDSSVPLVELNARVDRLLNFVTLYVEHASENIDNIDEV